MAAHPSPLAQFEIKRWVPIEIGDVDVSLTNSAAFMVLTVVAIGVFLILGMRRPAMVPGRWQSMVELSYVFIANLVKDTVGTEGRPYFPFIFTVFMFVLVGNLIGMVPYGFTFTSHIIVVLTLTVPAMILGETSLSFLGLGLRPPVVSWGVMLQDCLNMEVVANYPWLLLPLTFIIATVLCFNFVGDGMRDAADPYSAR